MPDRPRPEPLRPGRRVVLLDGLRGFALWGVLVVNTFIIARPPYGSVSDYEAVLPTDEAVAWLVRAFVSGKFYTLFGFLFGVSFAVQLARLRGRSVAPVPWLFRRLLVLLAVGVAHSVLVWNGDILKLYAVLGLALLALRRSSPNRLLKLGIALLGVFYLAYSSVAIGIAMSSPAPEGAPGGGVEASTEEPAHRGPGNPLRIDGPEVFRTGSYREVTQERVRLLFSPRQLGLLLAGVLYVFPLFLLGGWFAAREMYLPTESSRRTNRRLLLGSGVAGAASCAGFLYFGAILGGERGTLAGAAKVICEQVSHLALGLLYLSLFVALAHARPASRGLSLLAPVGRMALTTYLVHSVLLTWLMYGYGLGLADRLSPTPLLLGASILYLVLLGLSTLWLRSFRFGPIEWAWRSLTYGSLQPLRSRSHVVSSA